MRLDSLPLLLNNEVRAKKQLENRPKVSNTCADFSKQISFVCAGCDKNIPGVVMAMGRLNRPSLMIHGGTVKPGKTCLSNKPVDVMSAVQSYGESVQLGAASVVIIQGFECPTATHPMCELCLPSHISQSRQYVNTRSFRPHLRVLGFAAV